jgi:isocitrate dehydrogenase
MSSSPSITYTWADEAPALATYAFLPIIRAFASAVGIRIETRDISLAGRIIAVFPDFLNEDQRVNNDLRDLGNLVKIPQANIIKLPNISASIPQMKACIAELQEKGYRLPDYPENPVNQDEQEIKARYDSVKGSAVNPVLRQGNSDRRAPDSVKEFAKKNPPDMKEWPSTSSTHVATMDSGDFYHNEVSITIDTPTIATVEHIASDGSKTILIESLALEAEEVLDCTFMSRDKLIDFLRDEISDAKEKKTLFSLHLKATMMKISDPIIFGHCVKVFFAKMLEKHASILTSLGVNPNNGLGDLLDKVRTLPEDERVQIQNDIDTCYQDGPDIAMVDSSKGITNLHVPSDVIIDASIPPMIRDSGRLWNVKGDLEDCKVVIPDSSYAGIYDAVVKDCQDHGQYDPARMGSVSNVGLMAQKAEEYGSHDKTFEIKSAGTVRILDENGAILLESEVDEGDIWRACQTKDIPVRNWVQLAVQRARSTGTPAVFWLDSSRAHDDQLVYKVHKYLKEHDTDGLQIEILAPVDAMNFSLDRIRKGQDTISVTGNVLRDYLTDLFPILEIGTSARMLSIVPLLNGGGLFETGAGGSAPKHVQQFESEGHLRWDSLGEYMALASSLQHLGDQFGDVGGNILGQALDKAIGVYLDNNRSPSRKVHGLDNRGSLFYLTLYWAEAMVEQEQDPKLSSHFLPIANAFAENSDRILDELYAVQGEPQDIGGYYKPEPDKASVAMRPSLSFNEIVENISKPRTAV